MTVQQQDLERLLLHLRGTVRDPRAGLFGPGSATWAIAREAAIFLGGGRAALLQLAHPFVAHGVDQHSKTRTDPAGRFIRTFENVFDMAFGDLDAAITSARRVHAIHPATRRRPPHPGHGRRRGRVSQPLLAASSWRRASAVPAVR